MPYQSIRLQHQNLTHKPILAMEKKEYFDILLKRDFIRYVILRKPRLSPEEVSKKLLREFDINRLYHRMKDAMTAVCDKHLAFSKIQTPEGRTVKELPDWLNPDYAKEILADYELLIQKEFATENFQSSIISQIERLIWLQGVDDMAQNLRAFISEINKIAKDYANIPVSSSDQYDLQEKYDAARKITVKERILNSNDNDIILFRGALLDYAKALCESALYRQLSKLYSDIANSKELADIIDKFATLHKESTKELTTLSIPSHPEEWDEEYARLVPTEFFERNIDDVDAPMAFHMILLQSFARNEEKLKNEGFLTPNGEVWLFTNPIFHSTNRGDIIETIKIG